MVICYSSKGKLKRLCTIDSQVKNSASKCRFTFTRYVNLKQLSEFSASVLSFLQTGYQHIYYIWSLGLGSPEGEKWYHLICSFRLPWWLSGKESACQCRRHGFKLWVGKIPWRRKWQPCLEIPRTEEQMKKMWWINTEGSITHPFKRWKFCLLWQRGWTLRTSC